MGRRRSFRGALRSRFRLVGIWLLLGGLACLHWIDRFCSSQPEGTCQTIAAGVAIGIPLLLLAAFFLHVIYRRATREDFSEPGFKNQPQKADGEIIRFYGKIEFVLKDRLGEKMKRKVTDVYRTMVNDGDGANRFIHQRFVISSPQLRRGERLMVHHNTSFGKVSIRKGKWVEAQGEYVHKRAKRRTFWGTKDTFYGLVHYTHEPRGGIRILKRRPELTLKNARVRVLKTKQTEPEINSAEE